MGVETTPEGLRDVDHLETGGSRRPDDTLPNEAERSEVVREGPVPFAY